MTGKRKNNHKVKLYRRKKKENSSIEDLQSAYENVSLNFLFPFPTLYFFIQLIAFNVDRQ